MDRIRTTDNDASSTYEEFIDMDVMEDNVAMMSDEECAAEMEVINKWKKALELSKSNVCKAKDMEPNVSGHTGNSSVVGKTESTLNSSNDTGPRCDDTPNIETKTLSNTPLATPKIHSVVVIPESASICPNVVVPKLRETVRLETKAQKQNRNRNGSTKNKAKESDGSLRAMLSKGFMQCRPNGSKPVDKQANEESIGTPTNVKRLRSAGTTPEADKGQPEKLTKLQDGAYRKAPLEKSEKSKYNLLDRRTLNLKVCASCKPLTSMEMGTIKRFLRYQIEQALENRTEFIPIFTEPCKIGKDGVYVYCADQKCAQWLTYMVKGGIPDIPSKLVVLPHETQVQLDPVFVQVRVVMNIPTKRPGDMILRDLAQLNKDLNTERWRITKIRAKGSSGSTVYMKMDKRSFDTISAREGNRVNWILGPININQEVHKAHPKKSNPQSVTGMSSTTPNSETTVRHLKPPFVKSVESTPVVTDREPAGAHRVASTDGHPQRRSQTQPRHNE